MGMVNRAYVPNFTQERSHTSLISSAISSDFIHHGLFCYFPGKNCKPNWIKVIDGTKVQESLESRNYSVMWLMSD